MPYIIAIDIGTTHCKALIVDEQANAIQSFKLPVVSIQKQQTHHEQDPDQIFDSVIQLLHQSLRAINVENVSCICFSAAMHSIMAVDKKGKPLTHAITWADTRSRQYAQQLRHTEKGEKIYRQTGTPIHAMSPFCKILFLQNEEPELFAKTYKFISIKEYVFYRLFQKYIVDVGIASTTGLYDVFNFCWNKEALEIAGIDETYLSQVVEAMHTETTLVPDVKEQLHLKKVIPFVIGGNDGCLANLGCGALSMNEAALTIGTSGAVRVTIPRLEPSKGNGLFKYLLTKDIYVTGGGINNGGITLQWFAENFLQLKIAATDDLHKVLQLAATVPAGAEGVLFLPYLLGERAPVWDEDATAMFYGLKMHHTKAHLTRAVVEGISFSLLQILKNVEASGVVVNKVYTSGIVTQSGWWMQLLADMMGKTIVLINATDASAMGAAFIGMKAVGMINELFSVTSFIQTSKVFEANNVVHQLYQQQYKAYSALYPATQSFPPFSASILAT